MGEITDIKKRPVGKRSSLQPIVPGRPKWTNIALILSLLVFWAGVILKLIG